MFKKEKTEHIIGILFFTSIFINIGLSYKVIYFYHLLIPIISLYILTEKSRINKLKNIARRKINLAFFGSFIFYCISILWSDNPGYAVQYVFQFGIGISALLFSQYFIYDKKTFLFYTKNVFSIMLVLICVISLLEIYTDFRWPISKMSHYNSYFGRPNFTGEILTSLNTDYVMSSPTVFFWNQNHLAVFLCIWLPFFMKRNIKHLLIFTIFTIIIVYTASRFTLLSIGFVLLLSIIVEKKNSLFFVYFVGLLTLPIYLIPNSTYAMKSYEPISKIITLKKTDPNVEPDDKSQSVRLQLYKQGFQDIIQSKFIGVGAGNARWKNELQKENTEGQTSVHFYWLEILINGGIIVFSLFTFILFSLLHYFYKNRKSSINKYILFSILIYSFSVISLSSAIYFLPFYTLVGLLVSIKNNKINLND